MGGGLLFVTGCAANQASQSLEGSNVGLPLGQMAESCTTVPGHSGVVPDEVCLGGSAGAGLHLAEMLRGQQICQSAEIITLSSSKVQFAWTPGAYLPAGEA